MAWNVGVEHHTAASVLRKGYCPAGTVGGGTSAVRGRCVLCSVSALRVGLGSHRAGGDAARHGSREAQCAARESGRGAGTVTPGPGTDALRQESEGDGGDRAETPG